MKLTANQKRLFTMILVGLALLVILLTLQKWWEARNDATEGAGGQVTQTSLVSADEKAAAISILSKLSVAPKGEEGYERRAFGSAWADVDDNGCDTRNDILKRDLTNITYKDAKNCVVLSGSLLDPYTGKTINFVRGGGALVDIDHMVALGNVWASGGGKLTPEKRQAVANDPVNLLAVDAPANRAKGDKNAAEWLPPNKSFQCRYVVAQITVKGKYSLSVTTDEKKTMEAVLAQC